MTPDAAELAPVDRLLLAEALDIAGRADGAAPLADDGLVVIGAPDDALALAAADALGATGARYFADLVPADAPAPAGVRRLPLGPELVAGARVVLARAPKPLAEVEELADLVARAAADDAVLLVAGRDKHLSRGLNTLLGTRFEHVRASLGRWKSRAVVASRPRRDAAGDPFPRSAAVDELGFAIHAHGGAFAGTRLDLGTRVLLGVLDDALDRAGLGPDAVGTAVDLGCGTGVLATALARRRPGFEVVATDRSWAAVSSAAATAAAAGVGDRVRVAQADAAAGIPDASADLVLLNPPFHEGHAVVDRLADPLFAAAARVLRPGGSLVTVFNSHLRHRPSLERLVGPTEQLVRTAKFTVTRSTARPGEAGGARV